MSYWLGLGIGFLAGLFIGIGLMRILQTKKVENVVII